MSWLTETTRHAHRLAYHRARGPLRPARPLDMAVLIHDRAPTLAVFLDALITRTQWPLRIRLCDNASTERTTHELLDHWNGRQAGPHRVTVLSRERAAYPEGFSDALDQMHDDVCVLSEGRVIVPDLGRICWATAMLQLMYDFPQVGWLNATVNLPPLPGLPAIRRRPVRGTRHTIIRDTPDTQLALVRRDCFAPGGDATFRLKGIYQEQLAEEYCSGRAAMVVTQPIEETGAPPSGKEGSARSLERPRFHIITRTHARPGLFARCRASVERQTRFSDVLHIVTYEDDTDLAYVPESCLRVPVHPEPEIPCWYESYINEAMRYVTHPGWVMFLDDDDYLVNSRLVETVIGQAAHIDAVFFRTRLHGKRVIPATLPFASPPYGDIASCGYVLRSEIAKRATWEPGHAGDYRYISQLFRLELGARKRIGWCTQVLTSTQDGRSAGKPSRAPHGELSFDDSIISVQTA
jgi:hypothetical protein